MSVNLYGTVLGTTYDLVLQCQLISTTRQHAIQREKMEHWNTHSCTYVCENYNVLN